MELFESSISERREISINTHHFFKQIFQHMSASSDAFCLGNQFFWCIVVKKQTYTDLIHICLPELALFEFTQCISMGQMGCDFSSLTNWSGVFRIYLISKYVCGARCWCFGPFLCAEYS